MSSVSVASDNSRRSDTKASPIYVAATRQHVGKTSTSLALLSGLQKRFENVGFMKPVGQQSLVVMENGRSVTVDKDATLVKEHFRLDHLNYSDMSPILIPPGYTRDYLGKKYLSYRGSFSCHSRCRLLELTITSFYRCSSDEKILLEDQEQKVERAYNNILQTSEVVLCEGTGHCSVGSIVDASNAHVASWLGAKMILVANGGLGNTFDELELNKVLCDREGVDICGVIINKVQPDKLEQTKHYLQKALHRYWGDVPLLGCIPDRPFLGCPALSDLEKLFNTKLLTGHQHRLRHYRVQDLNLVATSLSVFLKNLRKDPSRTLYVCHASRNDILLGFLMEQPQHTDKTGKRSEAALVVTGTDEYPLSDQVLGIIEGTNPEKAPPVILANHPTHRVMEMIHSYTPKLNFEDSHRADTAVAHYEPYIDFDLLLQRTGHAQYLAENTNA